MRVVELSIDERNYAAEVRDAVLGAIPGQCRDETGQACPEALERSYSIGQRAVREGVTAPMAAEWAWGNIGVCCQQVVEVQEVPVEVMPSEHRIPELAAV